VLLELDDAVDVVVAVDAVVVLLVDVDDAVDDVDARQGDPRSKCQYCAFVGTTSTLASKIWQTFFSTLYEKAPHSVQGDEL
jgi:hypothetical protein